MKITPMRPIVEVDWDKIDFVRCTLEQPFRPQGGSLRWRQGTTSAKKNLNYNAHDPNSGTPHHPGVPIMYPEDAPAIAGDPDRDSWVMPAAAAFTAFGYFHAPLEVPRNGIVGFTMSAERQRVALMWGYFKMPHGDGTMHPPMNRIGPPDVPAVAIRPLSKSMQPMRDDEGEIVVRVRDFWNFDDASQYEKIGVEPAHAEVAQMLSGFTAEEIEVLRDIVKAKVSRGKG